jgi:hypothetical protein
VCVLGIFEIGSHKLLAKAGFKPWSSWSLPPEQQGLQAWAVGTGLILGFELRALHLIHRCSTTLAMLPARPHLFKPLPVQHHHSADQASSTWTFERQLYASYTNGNTVCVHAFL